jgi:hypothetical protein
MACRVDHFAQKLGIGRQLRHHYEAAQQSPDALGDWEKCCRTMAALSVKLRLSPHSRSDPKTVMRASA